MKPSSMSMVKLLFAVLLALVDTTVSANTDELIYILALEKDGEELDETKQAVRQDLSASADM